MDTRANPDEIAIDPLLTDTLELADPALIPRFGLDFQESVRRLVVGYQTNPRLYQSRASEGQSRPGENQSGNEKEYHARAPSFSPVITVSER